MQRTCVQCSGVFKITESDLEFYDKVSPVFDEKKYPIPPPTLCPECRFQRRMIWRREHALKSRACDSCEKSIVSIHTADAPYPVYCLKCWWSDEFDPLEHGQPFDPSRSFFDQFFELYRRVPQITMMNDNGVASDNCEYCQDFGFGKNCYLITGAWKLQDCYYCDCNCLESRNLFDCYSVHFSELTYDSVASQRLYRCSCLNHSENCFDCTFGIDLIGCKNCVGCVNLRQKEFFILNEPYSEAEYRKKVASLELDTSAGWQHFKKEFEQWSLQFPRKAVHQINCEDCTGDDLFHCKNVIEGFQQDACEHCKFIVHGTGSKNSYDVSQTGNPQWCYDDVTPDNSYMTHFSMWCWQDKNVLYSDNCHSCEHLFGCIGLKRKKYCILNKQYTKEEYEKMVGTIIERMMADGEWGEFFPMRFSPFCFNETAAQEYFPLTKEDVTKRGLHWRDRDPKEYQKQTAEIPEKIQDVPDTIVNEVLACLECKRNFKILKQELDFYRTLKIPAPRLCYECRWAERVQRRNPRKLWNRACAKCSKPISTTFSPERPEIVYCESCYLASVY
jgi:hypothetical protein